MSYGNNSKQQQHGQEEKREGRKRKREEEKNKKKRVVLLISNVDENTGENWVFPVQASSGGAALDAPPVPESFNSIADLTAEELRIHVINPKTGTHQSLETYFSSLFPEKAQPAKKDAA